MVISYCFEKTNAWERDMKKVVLTTLVLVLGLFIITAQSVSETKEEAAYVSFTDSCGRTVEIPSSITKVAPSGAVATMYFAAIAPEYMCNVNSAPENAQMVYLPQQLANLPATGSLYGSKSTVNYEELIKTGAQILVDIGDYKSSIKEDLDALQAQIGIPCIFIEGNLEHMAQAFRTLGSILEGKEERGEALAAFTEKTVAMAKENSAKVKDEEKVRVLYTTGADGLGTNAKGSTQAQVLDLVGAENAVVLEKVTNKGGGNVINAEQLYNADPDLIVFSSDSIYDSVANDSVWSNLRAVKEGKYYEIPDKPYNWLSGPPSINMLAGIWWLGNLVYPQYFDYSVEEVIKEYYSLFWNYSLSQAEVENLLSRAR